MADIRIARPKTGASQNIPCEADAQFVFDFPAGEAILARDGDNLAIAFDDGASIQLENFYTQYDSENLPSFNIDGEEVAAVLLAAPRFRGEMEGPRKARLNRPGQKASPRNPPECWAEAAALGGAAWQSFLYLRQAAGFCPDIIFTSSARGEALCLAEAFPEAFIVNHYESLPGPESMEAECNPAREGRLRIFRESALLVCPIKELAPEILEAMSCGLPAMCGLSNDFLRPGQNCLAAPERGDGALIKKLWKTGKILKNRRRGQRKYSG